MTPPGQGAAKSILILALEIVREYVMDKRVPVTDTLAVSVALPSDKDNDREPIVIDRVGVSVNVSVELGDRVGVLPDTELVGRAVPVLRETLFSSVHETLFDRLLACCDFECETEAVPDDRSNVSVSRPSDTEYVDERLSVAVDVKFQLTDLLRLSVLVTFADIDKEIENFDRDSDSENVGDAERVCVGELPESVPVAVNVRTDCESVRVLETVSETV